MNVFSLASLAGVNVVFGVILVAKGATVFGSLNLGMALFVAILALRNDQ